MNFWSSIVQFFYSVDWEKFWGVLAGGLLASFTAFVVEWIRNKNKRRSNLKQLRNYLHAFKAEIEGNFLFLENIKNKAIVTASQIKFLCTAARDTCLSNLGSIPIKESTEIVEYLVTVYTAFDKINHIWEGTYRRAIAEITYKGEAEKLDLKDEAIEGAQEEAEKAWGKIKELLNKIELRIPKGERVKESNSQPE